MFDSIMRGEGNVRVPALWSSASLILQIGLTPLFMFVLGWGLVGAALAALTSQLLATIPRALYVFGGRGIDALLGGPGEEKGYHAKKADAAHQFIDLALSKEIQTELAKALKAGPVNGGATVPAAYHGQPGIFLTPAEWKERAYSINDEVRAKNLPAWREWFTANIVK